MEVLAALVASCRSGPALLSTLRSSNLESTSLPGLIADVIHQRASSGAGGSDLGAAVGARSLGAGLCVLEQMSFISPRGKHSLAFFDDAFVIVTNKGQICVPYSSVSHMLILDSLPKDTKGRVLLYLHLPTVAGIMNGKSPLTAVVLQTTATTELSVRKPQHPEQKLEGVAAVVLCQLFGLLGVPPSSFSSPQPEVFSSQKGDAGIEAHLKARPGTLFPLPSGLCFLESPALFIPLADIASMELARAGGTSSTFDVYVHTRDGGVREFAALPREEAGPLEKYMAACKISGAAGSESDGGPQSAGRAAQQDSDEDSEDESFAPECSTSSGGSGDERRDGGGSEASSQGGSSGSEGGSVELVSEDGFPRGALDSILSKEREGEHSSKRRRTAG